MRNIINGILVSFSLYSAIPVRQVEWNKSTMRFALSFIPLIGIIIGILELLWYVFCSYFHASELLYSVVSAIIPVVVSGGIHLDGFCDTCDALCSFGDMEKKLNILKDPHVGAFGVIWLISFIAFETALFSQIYKTPKFICLLIMCFAIARAIGASKIVCLKCAKNSGLAHIFSENSDKKFVFYALMAQSVLYITIMFLICFVLSINIIIPAIISILLITAFLMHNRLCINTFSGITGDLAGFLISITELIIIAIIAIGGMVL